MDGCLICGVRHIGSCRPDHPAHRPLSAEEWAEREARAAEQQPTQKGSSEPDRPLDTTTPGPTEGGGGSFLVFESKAAAEEHIRSLPPSQTATLDRIIDADGPTTSYAVTTSASPSRGEEQSGRAALAFVTEHRDRVEAAVAALKDPDARAKAEQLLQTIREGAATREQTPSRAQEVEQER